MYNEEQQAWVLIGITSFGYGCGKPNKSAVYAKVDHVLPWIRNISSIYSPKEQGKNKGLVLVR